VFRLYVRVCELCIIALDICQVYFQLATGHGGNRIREFHIQKLHPVLLSEDHTLQRAKDSSTSAQQAMSERHTKGEVSILETVVPEGKCSPRLGNPQTRKREQRFSP
jgi:hypothetical protein